MSRYDASNIFEKIGSVIPGCEGYSRREGRRDADKLLRLEMAKRVDRLKEPVNKIIRQQIDNRNLDLIKDLDGIKRNLDMAANMILFAPCGESGFFDAVQINPDDLDRLYRYEMGIKEQVAHLAHKIYSLRSREHLMTDCALIMDILSALIASIQDRERRDNVSPDATEKAN
jgi:hypothetical protein